jgi:tRNA(adenine34) deaminase
LWEITLFNSLIIMNHEYFMRLALEQANQGDAPYGAVIVTDNQVVAAGYNTVLRDHDPSAHAEINTIRYLTTQLQSPKLDGCRIYTTGEPCPMCASACIWAGISEIIYAVSIEDLIALNQSQINISCEEVIAKSDKAIKVTKGVLRAEVLKLFAPSCTRYSEQNK